MNKTKQWSFSGIWNQMLDIGKPDRPIEPRQRIWASELSKPDVDIYLKLIGTEPSNKPNARSKRKFQAGDIWEYIVKNVLLRAGILKGTQKYIVHETEGKLSVTGKIDFEVGGAVDYAKARQDVEALYDEEFPFLYNTAKATIEYFEKEYPDGLDEKLIEVKSVGERAFAKVEAFMKALAGHDLQLFHYCHKEQKEGVLVYVCRDDCRVIEIPILPNDQKLLARYNEKIDRMSKYYNAHEQPPIEKEILFDEDYGKFTKNFGIEYSSFLTMLYGYEEPKEYADKVAKLCTRWNRVLGRIKKNESMTKNNLEAIEEIRQFGFDADLIVETAKQKAQYVEDDDVIE